MVSAALPVHWECTALAAFSRWGRGIFQSQRERLSSSPVFPSVASVYVWVWHRFWFTAHTASQGRHGSSDLQKKHCCNYSDSEYIHYMQARLQGFLEMNVVTVMSLLLTAYYCHTNVIVKREVINSDNHVIATVLHWVTYLSLTVLTVSLVSLLRKCWVISNST